MSVPSDRAYSAEHEWVRVGDLAEVGITQFAADALGDVVYVQLPDVGSSVVAGQPCGEIESTKSVSDLYAPVSGEVVEVNQEVVDNPSLINADPYEAGWVFRVRTDGSADLLDADAYVALIGE